MTFFTTYVPLYWGLHPDDRKDLSIRALHNAVNLISSMASYIAALSWIRAFMTATGSIGPNRFDVLDLSEIKLDTFQLVFLWIGTFFLTWLIILCIKMAIRTATNRSKAFNENHHVVMRFLYLVTSGISGMFCSAGTYALMYGWSISVMATLGDPGILGVWIFVGCVTLLCAAMLVSGQRGHGPLRFLDEYPRNSAERQQLEFLFLFNMGFLLPFCWLRATSETAAALFPGYQKVILDKWIFCITVMALALLLRALYQRSLTDHACKEFLEANKVASTESGPTSSIQETDEEKQLLQQQQGTHHLGSMEDILNLSQELSLTALTLLPAIAYNMTLPGTLAVIALSSQTLAYFINIALALFSVAIYSVFASFAEKAILIRAMQILKLSTQQHPGPTTGSGGRSSQQSMHSETHDSSVHTHTTSQEVYMNRYEGDPLLWYMNTVIFPKLARVMSSVDTHTSQELAQQFFDLEYTKHMIFGMLRAAALMSGAAWNNLILQMFDKYSTKRYWTFAIVVTSVAALLDVTMINVHMIVERFGIDTLTEDIKLLDL